MQTLINCNSLYLFIHYILNKSINTKEILVSNMSKVFFFQKKALPCASNFCTDSAACPNKAKPLSRGRRKALNRGMQLTKLERRSTSCMKVPMENCEYLREIVPPTANWFSQCIRKILDSHRILETV